MPLEQVAILLRIRGGFSAGLGLWSFYSRASVSVLAASLTVEIRAKFGVFQCVVAVPPL